MSRIDWQDLSAATRAAIQTQTGPVATATTAAAGATSDLTVTLHLADGGRVFCKGIRANVPAAWMHRTEARTTAALPVGLAPRLLWEITTDDWLILGLEHLDGRHADLSPGSADLPRLATALTRLAEALTPSPLAPVQPLDARWATPLGWAKLRDDPPPTLSGATRRYLTALTEHEAHAPRLLAGDTLSHTDPVPTNMLVTDGQIRLIDWAWPARAAAWVDTAFVLLRLLDAGHSIDQAEAWASTVTAYRGADEHAVTAFAAAVSGLWTWRAHTTPTERQHALAATARTWAQHRLTA